MNRSIFDYASVSDQEYVEYCNDRLLEHGVTDEKISLVGNSCSLGRYVIVNSTNGIIRYYNFRLQGFGFSQGLAFVADKIASAYHIGEVSLQHGDIVVDVGANTGDLELYLRLNDLRCSYVGIEPAPMEFQCLKKNVSDQYHSQALNLALGQHSGLSQFYLSPESGDSSCVPPASYSEVINISIVTLDELLPKIIKTYPAQQLKLLKLEAEGYEPEIIAGAKNVISLFPFVSADLGWERGPSNQTTAPVVVNSLLSIGFTIAAIGRERLTILFKNSSLPSGLSKTHKDEIICFG